MNECMVHSCVICNAGQVILKIAICRPTLTGSHARDAALSKQSD